MNVHNELEFSSQAINPFKVSKCEWWYSNLSQIFHKMAALSLMCLLFLCSLILSNIFTEQIQKRNIQYQYEKQLIWKSQYKEVNCDDPFPSVSIPCPNYHLSPVLSNYDWYGLCTSMVEKKHPRNTLQDIYLPNPASGCIVSHSSVNQCQLCQSSSVNYAKLK